MTRCRLCTTNDRDSLVDDVAREMWESEASRVPWAETYPQWHRAYRMQAEAALRVLERDHD